MDFKSINYEFESLSEVDGKVGDIKITKATPDSGPALYFLGVKTEDGWRKPVIGETPLTFKRLSSNVKKETKKSIDEIESTDTSTNDTIAKKTIFDEKADKFVIARPDYDSGWVDVANTQTTGTHNLESIPIFQQIWWTDDDGVTVHRTYSSNNTSYTLELTTTGWQITGDTYYGYVCLSGTALTRIDYTGYKVKILLWK